MTEPHHAAKHGRVTTMREVAAAAGVSLKTVSRVINGEAGVSAGLAERVEETVRLLGYRPNLVASGLRRSDRKTATIGLLLDDIANPFDSTLHRTVEDVARRHGSLVLAGSSERDSARERAVLQAFAGRKVDGLVAVPAGRDHSALLHEHRLGTPIVFVDRPDPSGACDSVLTDNRAGAELAVTHLAAGGHRRIALLTDLADLWTANERAKGYSAAMARLGLPIAMGMVQIDIVGVAAAEEVVLRLLSSSTPPTAIFAAQNLLTIGALRALRTLGLSREVAVVGFDDFAAADLLEPAVSVVAQDVAQLGRTSAEILFRRLGPDQFPAGTQMLPPTLITRGSGEIAGPGGT